MDEATRLARVRVWAAAVRDRAAPYQHVSDHHARLAGTVCHLIDTRNVLAAHNARASSDISVHLLIGELICSGVWPQDA